MSVSFLFAISTLGCGSSQSGGPGDASPEGRADVHTTDAKHEAGPDAAQLWPTPPAWNAKVTPPASDTAATADRAACKFKRGDMPAATVNPSFLLDDMNPIQNIVVLMQENRSFDTYMGHLYKYEVDVLGRKTATAINSAPDNTTNTDLMGMTHPYQHAPHLCFADTDHSWRGSHVDWDKGKNDLFFDVNDGTMVNEAGVNLLDGDRALWWYDERDIPFYYSLYSTFAISDSYFCALLGPTWPNRAYLYDATSLGITESTFPNLTNYETVPTNLLVFDELAQRGVPFNIFAESVPGIGLVLGPSVTTRYGSLKPIVPLADFFTRAKAGTLPPVSFVDPDFLDEAMGSDDEHPPGDVEVGQGATWKVVNALLTSPQWAHSALFITYDEGGGEYDHVSPPPACAPDDLKPILTGTDVGTTGDFTRYGFRVPLVIVSPYARKSFVSHTTYSHTSITRFIEAKFKLPALTARDANADPFSDMFDWTNPPFAKPPTFAEPKVDTSALAFCKATY